jgi:chemotaxis protein MotB
MARRKKHEEHENHERWLVSYADFITLLFAFFVVLYATSNQDISKAKEFEGSLRSSIKMGEYGGGNNPINFETGSTFAPLGNQLKDASPIDLQSYYQKKIQQKLSIEERGAIIQDLIYDKNGIRIRLQGSNLFKPGDINLNPQAAVALGKLGIILKGSRRKMVVEGHTDNQQLTPNGVISSNWELGALRATTVVRYFVNQFQVPQDKISAMSFGDTHPVGDNTTQEGRAENRRIEIFVQSDKPL